MKAVSWDDFRLVQAVADSGSLAGAGERLSLNHSTVFRRLNALEQELGAKLFERARTGYTPTPAGEEMVALAARMHDDIAEFERRVAGRDVKPSGELRVTTNDALVAHLLTPLFGAFARAFPDIVLDVIVENRSLNLSRRDADVAIRATAEPPETLVGRRLATIGWCVYGAARDDLPQPARDAAALADECWITLGDSLATIAPARWLSRALPQAKIVYRLNTILGLSQAVQAGIGVALLPCFIGDRTPGVVRRMADPINFDTALWLLTHADLRAAARVRSFMEFMSRELARQRPLIEGRGPSQGQP